jgi:hypothetical protein
MHVGPNECWLCFEWIVLIGLCRACTVILGAVATPTPFHSIPRALLARIPNLGPLKWKITAISDKPPVTDP